MTIFLIKLLKISQLERVSLIFFIFTNIDTFFFYSIQFYFICNLNRLVFFSFDLLIKSYSKNVEQNVESF